MIAERLKAASIHAKVTVGFGDAPPMPLVALMPEQRASILADFETHALVIKLCPDTGCHPLKKTRTKGLLHIVSGSNYLNSLNQAATVKAERAAEVTVKAAMRAGHLAEIKAEKMRRPPPSPPRRPPRRPQPLPPPPPPQEPRKPCLIRHLCTLQHLRASARRRRPCSRQRVLPTAPTARQSACAA